VIYYLVRRRSKVEINLFLADWARTLKADIKPIEYERLFRWNRIPVGSYIFSGLEPLTSRELEMAHACWRSLAACGETVELLNNPLRVKLRYELLRTLHAAGINDFNVYRLDEDQTPKRFPVFIRGENDHNGPETDLIHSEAQLRNEIDRLVGEGKSRHTRIIVEALPYADSQGIYHKYGAFRVGDHIFPRHLLLSHDWVAKTGSRTTDSAGLQREIDYVRENPHRDALRRVFEIAQIEFGRVDYTICNGKVQVFEINTGPSFVTPGPSRAALRTEIKTAFTRQFIDACGKLQHPKKTSGQVRVDYGHPPLLGSGKLGDLILLAATKLPFGSRFEPEIHRRLIDFRKKWRR
jgi:hypothetical protein